MRILAVAFGNEKEAYVETALEKNLNIVSSDDNNKGKTILIQSLLYALGNVPAFPASFNYPDYFYYVSFDVNSKIYLVCRKASVFVVKSEKDIMLLEGVSEFKRYWHNSIMKLPQICKDESNRIVDPELLFQLFFVGQDRKDTSNIANKGYYNKEDFYSMLYALMDFGTKGMSAYDTELAKKRLIEIKTEKDSLLRQFKILRSAQKSAAYLSATNDKFTLESKIQEIDQITRSISGLRVERNKYLNRKSKYEVALHELHSLNRSVDGGELRCLSCNSNHIGFITDKKQSYSFDVTTAEIRKQIINSIEEKIQSYCEEIDKLSVSINEQQQYLTNALAESDITLESIVLLKSEIVDADEAEKRIAILDREQAMIKDSLRTNEQSNAIQIQKQEQLISTITSFMQTAYREVDQFGTLFFDDIFTKKDQIFSGSEATLFNLIKLYALCIVTKHEFPIIFDSFRAEDLSSEKEERIINLFGKIKNQIIFTTTLKAEELGKYYNDRRLNHIDFSKNKPSKILSADYLDSFSSLLEELKIKLE
jgi:hypothetical protein